MIIGFDGFVDEIIHVVRKRPDFNSFERMQTITELSERIGRASGYSTNVEFVPVQTKLGGNGPILSNALVGYGVNLTYIGALGYPDIHPVFKQLAQSSTVYSICDPAHTDALEFTDGKLLLGKLDVLNNLNWESIREKVGGVHEFAEMINSCDLLGMGNWTMISMMNGIWEGMIGEMFPLLDPDRRPYAFFDLADPEKRTKEDIKKALRLISAFSERFDVILGLNGKEANEIAGVMGLTGFEDLPDGERLKAVTAGIFGKMDIHCVVVHLIKEASAVTADGYMNVKGPYCKDPVLTTGAGDNFNAGFCFAKSMGLDIGQSLTAGVCTSGYYVRNARSPKIEEAVDFMMNYESVTE